MLPLLLLLLPLHRLLVVLLLPLLLLLLLQLRLDLARRAALGLAPVLVHRLILLVLREPLILDRRP